MYPPTGHRPVRSLTRTLLVPSLRIFMQEKINPEDKRRAGDSGPFSQPQMGECSSTDLFLSPICLRHSTCFLNLGFCLTSLCARLGNEAKRAAVTP